MNLIFQTMIGFLQLHASAVMAVIVALVALYGAVYLMKLSINKHDIKLTSYAGIGFWIILMLTLPAATKSSLAQVETIPDYLLLISMSLGFAVLLAIMVLPLLKIVQHLKPAE